MPSRSSSPRTASSSRSTSPSLAESGQHARLAEVAEGREALESRGGRGGVRGWLGRYPLSFARRDFQAGVTVAAISLPQSMAYALIAGVDPRFGLFTAIVFTAVGSIFGSSSHLINGPTGAVSLVVFSTLSIFEPDK